MDAVPSAFDTPQLGATGTPAKAVPGGSGITGGCGEKDGLTAVRIWSSRHVAMALIVSRLLLSSGTKRSMRQLGSMWWDRLLGRTDVGVISRHCRVELGLSEFIFKVHDTLQCMIYV